MSARPNVVLLGIDSLRADHMSLYGYDRLTTPHIDAFARGGAVFERTYSPHIPTTSAYGSMLTGRDAFGTQIVALRHKGGMRTDIRTLAEILKDEGYNTTCVGFTGNPSARGFDTYLDYAGWGSWNEGRSPKAENLNAVALPELERLAAEDRPFFLFLRHMDPHSPYLPPAPFERMFYHGDETDPANASMAPILGFAPFANYFLSWMPPGITDKAYVNAQYDGAIAYMDAAIRRIFTALETLGVLENTIVVINGDHGETLDEHDCYYDHHGMYDNTLHVPLVIRYPARVPQGVRVAGFNQHKDLVPTILDLAGIAFADEHEGRSLMALVRGEVDDFDREFYITECTWMRKHGWRTPEWKLIVALEPDFHFKPEIELYDLRADPQENENLADRRPEIVADLRARMEAFIARRERETGKPNPIHDQDGWHNQPKRGPFETSQEAYDTMRIGDSRQAAKLQSEARK